PGADRLPSPARRRAGAGGGGHAAGTGRTGPAPARPPRRGGHGGHHDRRGAADMRRALRLVPYALAVLVALGLTGCGVGATDRPVDEGDAAVGGSANPARQPPEPDEAGSFEELVRYFLQASAG